MSDEPTLPPSWESHDGYDEDLTIERDLRAAFAPIPAPHDFRERLKADLLRGDERLVLLSARGAPRQRFSRRMLGVVDAVATHPRALAAATLAAAAAILLAVALNANNFGGHDYGYPLPATPRPTPPSPTMTATPSRPTVTATPRVAPTATAQPVLAPPRPTATMELAPATPTSAAATARPQPTATRALATNQSALTVTPARTASPSPVLEAATAVPPPPSATATRPPVAVVQRVITPTPTQPAPTSTTIPPTSTAIPTPTTIPPTSTAIPTPTTPLLSPTPIKKRVGTPGAHVKKQLVPTVSPTRAPLPSATETPVQRPAIVPTVRVAATATPHPTTTPRPTATPRPSATLRPTATSRPTATVTATVAPTATASATPVPTAVAHNVLGPASRPSFLLPSADNTALNSPLQGALTTDAIQGISFTAPQTWTPPQLTSPYLPVYPIARVPVTTTDVLTVTRELGARDVSAITMQEDGGIAAHVQVDGAPYTLTVYAGYGTPRFTLHALASEPGTLSSVRLTAQASAWLQYHGNLLHPDMRALPPSSGVMTYSQTVSDTAILGPVALSLSFDGRGGLRDLSYNYIVPNAPILAPAQSSIIAASTAILTYDGQALYVGPQPSTATGPAIISGLTLAYVGVRDVKDDYLEPVYVLNGGVSVGGAADSQPFDLYISALAPPVSVSTTGP